MITSTAPRDQVSRPPSSNASGHGLTDATSGNEDYFTVWARDAFGNLRFGDGSGNGTPELVPGPAAVVGGGCG